MKTLQHYLQEPALSGDFPPARLEALEGILAVNHRSDMPWYLRFIIGLGAWIASLFFIGAVGAFLNWSDDLEQVVGWFGVVALLVVVLAGRFRPGLFVSQCLLAINFAAQAMIYYGFAGQLTSPLGPAALIAIALALVLYIFHPYFLSRLVTCYAALMIVLFWMQGGVDAAAANSTGLPAAVPWYWAAQLAAVCWCFLDPRRSELLAPLGYALAASLATWQATSFWTLWVQVYPASGTSYAYLWFLSRIHPATVAAALFFIAAWAAGGGSALRPFIALWIGLAVALAAIACLGLAGVLLGLFFLLLGFSVQSRALLCLGLIVLPVFLADYYYNLQIDLLAKSGLLIGSGVVLLLLRGGRTKWAFTGSKEAA